MKATLLLALWGISAGAAELSAVNQQRTITGLAAIASGFSMIADSDLEGVDLLATGRAELAGALGCAQPESCSFRGRIGIAPSVLEQGSVGWSFWELENRTGLTPEAVVDGLNGGKSLGQIFAEAPRKTLDWSDAKIDAHVSAAAPLDEDVAREAIGLGESPAPVYREAAAPAERTVASLDYADAVQSVLDQSNADDRSLFELIHAGYARQRNLGR